MGREQAGAQFPVSRYADTVAVVAERIADRSDDTNPAFSIGKIIFAGRTDF